MTAKIDASLVTLGQQAQQASRQAAQLPTVTKNQVLEALATALVEQTNTVLAANQQDLTTAEISSRFVDRLKLTPERIQDMAAGLRALAQLSDPIGIVDQGWRTPQGLNITRVRVPLGVVGMIYEARPNVTVDAAGLCFKAGNAVILRGGREALQTNQSLVKILRQVLTEYDLNPNLVQLIEKTDHEYAQQFMNLTDYVDVLIPRGSARLIQSVVQHATVPVIETGAGNCHVYVDNVAELDMAQEIILNGKVQRPSVCNATEKVLVHEQVAAEFIPDLVAALRQNQVEVRGDEVVQELVPDVVPATAADWDTEYNDLVIAIKVVPDETAAIDWINQHGTRHSEVIVTDDYPAARRFQQTVDAACVYVNASSRFTDGFEFGFGAEIGISTQKLHARGPMGLPALTTYKYLIDGDGQVRLS
ncbi:glutamate-5-semialdehyde dehydrogenase [Leuconostocaceae bacterium ESL0723]|nr:glutamate-5-semialdehyde dehydrogenase [Leuconostocaceae bacterium ESL0723]